MCFQKTAYWENKNIQGKNEQEKQQQTVFFFSEELLQGIFSNLRVGQYYLLSHFTTKEENHVKKGGLLLMCLSCIF